MVFYEQHKGYGIFLNEVELVEDLSVTRESKYKYFHTLCENIYTKFPLFYKSSRIAC
jgi:hypothetical protein